jgi:peptidoglycan/LPS O-acetylase OafA/YrhL
MGDSDLINPPVWYMRVESRMIFIMPLIVLTFQRYGWRFALPIFVVTALTDNLPFSLTFIFAYLGGCMVRRILLDSNRVVKGLKELKRVYLIGMVILGFLMIGIYHIFSLDQFTSHNIYQAVQTIGAMILLAVVYVRDFKWMQKPWLVHLGDFSYQLYLIHFVIMLAMRALELPLPLYMISVIIVSLISAYALYRLDVVASKRLNTLLTSKNK